MTQLKLTLALFISSLGTACHGRPEAAKPAPSAVAGKAAPVTPSSCEFHPAPHAFSLGERKDTGSADASDDFSPFGVEIGGAVALDDRFVVAVLAGESSGQALMLARVGFDGVGTSAVLERVHGDVAPPEVAASASDVIVAGMNSDAGGFTLRLFGLDPNLALKGKSREISIARDPSPAFDVALSGVHGLLVWEEVDPKRASSSIQAARFSPSNLGALSEPFEIDTQKVDLDAPRVVARAGGFWLAWIEHEKAKAGRDTADARVEPSTGDAATDPVILDELPSYVRIVPLDADGRSQGEPKRVSSRAGQVLVFDLVTAEDGAAVVTFRDEGRAPGVGAPGVKLARLALDGTLQEGALEGVVGSAPILLKDAHPAPPAKGLWVFANSDIAGSRLVELGAGDCLVPESESSPDAAAPKDIFSGADVLAVRAGNFLVARSLRGGAELEVGKCR